MNAPARIASLLACSRGAAFLEFTVVLPLLISLGFGLAEFGRALHHYHIVNKSMRDAARFAARVAVVCTAPGGGGQFADANDLTRARNLALTGQSEAGGKPILAYWDDPDSITVEIECLDNQDGSYRGRELIPQITADASVDFQDIGLLSVLGLGPITLSGRHQQVHIGE